MDPGPFTCRHTHARREEVTLPMLYRVRIDLAFLDPDQAQALYDQAAEVIGHALTIKPGEPNEPKGFISLQHCRRDEIPPGPCTETSRQETA